MQGGRPQREDAGRASGVLLQARTKRTRAPPAAPGSRRRHLPPPAAPGACSPGARPSAGRPSRVSPLPGSRPNANPLPRIALHYRVRRSCHPWGSGVHCDSNREVVPARSCDIGVSASSWGVGERAARHPGDGGAGSGQRPHGARPPAPESFARCATTRVLERHPNHWARRRPHPFSPHDRSHSPARHTARADRPVAPGPAGVTALVRSRHVRRRNPARA